MSRLCSRVVRLLLAYQKDYNSSLQIVIFSLLFHYWYDPALFSIFYPIFVFCVVLLSNPQQLPVPLYGKEKVELITEDIKTIKSYYGQSIASNGNVIESRDGYDFETHLRNMEVYEHWQGKWERFLISSAKQTDCTGSNNMLLVGVIDLMLKEAKSSLKASESFHNSKSLDGK